MVPYEFPALGRVVNRLGGEGTVASVLGLVGMAGLILVASGQPIRSGETGRVQLASLASSAGLRGEIDPSTPSGNEAEKPSTLAPPAKPVPTTPVRTTAVSVPELPAFDIWQPASLTDQEPRGPAANVSAAGTSLAELPAPVQVASLAEPEPAPAPSRPLPPSASAKAIRAVPPVAAPAKPHRPSFAETLAGTWAPQGGSCADLDGSEFLPLLIDKAKATAGDGSCAFGAKRQTGSRWSVVAECTDGTQSWTSNIDLAVDRNRLTWTSERGVATYTKCEPTVVAKADRKERVAARRTAAKVARAERAKAAPARAATRVGRAGKPGWAVLKVR